MITMIICKLSMKKICHKATSSQTYANLLHRSPQKLCCKKKMCLQMILPTILGVQSILIILTVLEINIHTHPK